MPLLLTPAVYTSDEDIANSALDLCGQPHLTTLQDDSKAAELISFNMPKLRQVELRRNIWRFSIKHAAIRPIDTTSKTLIPLAFNLATTYSVGSIVSYGGALWINFKPECLGVVPGVQTGGYNPWQNYFGPMMVTPYDSTTSYYSGELVYGVTNIVYYSLQSNNADDPVTNTNGTWLVLTGATMQAISMIFPIGAGPLGQSSTRNVYQLPYGFLREAPQSPKAGATNFLGAPTGLSYSDWVYEGNYIISSASEPIVLRFAADVTDVTQMDPMFAGGLAAVIAAVICEPVTQSTERLKNIGAMYTKRITEARTVNGIETGPTEPAEDDFITCRQ